MRSCLKSTGPGESSLIAAATSPIGIAPTISTGREIAQSITRLRPFRYIQISSPVIVNPEYFIIFGSARQFSGRLLCLSASYHIRKAKNKAQSSTVPCLRLSKNPVL